MVEELGQHAAAVDWGAVRRDYEAGDLRIALIARRHGITDCQIRYRREREGWYVRKARTVEPEALVMRMLILFERQVKRLDGEMKDKDSSAEKSVALLNTMARTLEKLLELEAEAKSGRRARPVMAIEDLREQLARRLENHRQS